MVAVAIGGAAVVGAGSSLVGSSKAASAATSAANSNNALQSQIYNQNSATLAPFVGSGTQAGNAINNLLGTNGNYAGYVQSNPDLLAAYNANNNGESMAQWGQSHWNTNGQYENRTSTPYSSNNGASNASAQAFQNWQNSTGYQQQLQTGQNQVQAALGSKGLLDSGAAQKALLNYGQQAANGSFQTYLGDLQGQQQTGLSAASAQAGVGQGYANSVSANNNTAATNTGNAALSGANSVNSALGSALTAYTYGQGLGSSYGGATANAGLGGIY